ncbi:MAG TPA: 3TM-type holin [Azospirillum sp.]|nr:3TM-type holin [Azospirillum sp.]
MLPALLAQIGLPVLIRAVSEGLGRIESPIAQTAAAALKDADSAIAAGAIPSQQVAEANRHVERLAELDADAAKTALAEVNRSLRAEVASDDPYVRRMRPTFGYGMALSWCAQMGALAYVVVADPAHAGAVIEAMASLGTIWTVGLSVLGIYVYKRSEEKTTAAGGAEASGVLGALARRLRGSAG